MKALIAILVSLLMLGNAEPVPVGDGSLVFKCSFDGPNCLDGWGGSLGKVVKGYKGTNSLFMENKDPSKSVTMGIRIPAERIAGQKITARAVIKAEGVGKPPNHWNGVKVMLVLQTKLGKQYPQLPLKAGTYDWTQSQEMLRVPKGVVQATLVVGLELVRGKVWFDEIEIRIGAPTRKGKRSKVRFKGHDLPRLRGVMHGPKFKEEDILVLAKEWKANQIRWQLNWVPMNKAAEWAQDLNRYDGWLNKALIEADQALEVCEKHGIKVLLDLHCPPGGRQEDHVCRIFNEKKYQDKLIAVWDRIARRYKGNRCVYAYDIFNEPIEPKTGGTITWVELATKVIDTIRAVDPKMPVVFEPIQCASPDGFDHMAPLDRDFIIYSFHMYRPHTFTHQGVYELPVGLEYPGVIKGVRWNKETLRESMAGAIDFQKAYNVQMYVGEFSAIRWAPNNSAYRYLKDCIDLFEEYEWDWSYHAYREYNGWSVEHGTDKNNVFPAKEQTDREKLLREWFGKN